MSVRLSSLLGLPDDPREIELINSLLAKTREGKIRWTKLGSALTAMIPNGFQINFVLGSTLGPMATYATWELLTVRDKNGSELLRVSHPGLIPTISGTAKSLLVAATDELFEAVYGALGDDLARAIDAIRKL